MVRVNRGAVSNAGEVANSDWVQLGADRHVVPDRRPLAHNNLANDRSVRGNPSILNLWDGVVDRHLLAVARRLSPVGDIIGELAANPVEL